MWRTAAPLAHRLVAQLHWNGTSWRLQVREPRPTSSTVAPDGPGGLWATGVDANPGGFWLHLTAALDEVASR